MDFKPEKKTHIFWPYTFTPRKVCLGNDSRKKSLIEVLFREKLYIFQ